MLKIKFSLIFISLCFLVSCSDSSNEVSGGGLFQPSRVSIEQTNKFSVQTQQNRSYSNGNHIDIVFNHPYNISVNGTPRIQINLDSGTVYANYFSGSNTSSLIFRYTVQGSDLNENQLSLSNLVDLNGGSLSFANNGIIENANLEINEALVFNNIDINIPTPLINNVAITSTGPYLENDVITFSITTNEDVSVLDTPRLLLNIGGSSRHVNYISGSNSSTLIFNYTVESGLEDIDGIELTPAIDLNGGSIKSLSYNKDIDTSFSSPDLSLHLVDSISPSVSIGTPLNLSYINTSNLSSTFAISGSCSEATRTVTIEIDSNPATTPVGFVCDGTSFSGTIDTTGLIDGAHTLTATLDDSVGNSTTSVIVNLLKDTVAPTISSISPPTNGSYIANINLDFIVNIDENVNVIGSPRIELNVNGLSRYATYQSGTGTNALTFRYTTANPEDDQDGIAISSNLIDLNSGTIIDNASNPINLDLTVSSALPDTSGILVDTIIPTVTITSSPDITAANQNIYLISGTCSEEGRTINVTIGSISLAPTCSSSAWNSGVVDVSGEADSGSFLITADHSDSAGNNATQSLVTVNKDTTTATVTISSSPNIDTSNQTDYILNGTCTENGVIVDINITDSTPTTINVQPNCSSGTWSTGSLDVSSLTDEVGISITADHATATQASITVDKDTLSPTVTISSSPNISLGNETSYIASGTCSENGVMVDINIDVLNFQPNCNNGSWTTGVIDLSSLSDGASLSFTVDHFSAPQASTTVSKNTATPSISSLSVPTTLSNSAELNWTLNDPGGFTVNDYEVNYRIKGTPTWLVYSDGISIDVNASVNSLVSATTYEFRIRVQYDSSQYSDWSMTAEGETKPDDPLFSSPNAAMNVGGATETAVVAFYDNTVVTLNGTPIADSPLSKGQKSVITTSQFDVIDADKPIYTAGKLGSGTGSNNQANIVWSPTAWAGKSFSFNATRANPQELYVYATEDATITVKQGSTVLDSLTISAGSGGTLNWSVYGSYQVTSTGTILAYHMSRQSGLYYDPKPVMPGYTELIGFPSRSARVTTNKDATNFNFIHSNSVIGNGNINKQDSYDMSYEGTAGLYREESVLVTADQKISAASFADSDGYCAAPFLPTNLMKKKYVINVNSEYVSFASKEAGTIDVYSPTQTIGVDAPVETLTLSRSGANSNAPYKVRRGATNEGYRFVSTVPVGAWYQPYNSSASGGDDETILYGTND